VARSLLKGPNPPLRYKHLKPGYKLSYSLSECLELIDLLMTDETTSPPLPRLLGGGGVDRGE